MDSMIELIKYTKKLNLLYVEDNMEARESTQLIFEEFFQSTTIAIDGVDGLEKFKKGEFDLIISDINMPKLNGLNMIEKIREINKDIPILVLSAYNESGYFIDSIKLSVDGYLLKPIDLEQFAITLEKIINKLKIKESLDYQIYISQQYQEATDHSTIVSKTDTSGIITYVNNEFCNISGYTKEELIGSTHNIIRHPDNSEAFYTQMWETISNKKQIWEGIVRNINKQGKSYYVKTTIKPILDTQGNILEYIALRDNITQIMNPKKQLDDAILNSKNPFLVYIKIEEYSILEELYSDNILENIQDKIKIFLEKKLPKNLSFDNIYQLGNGEYALLSEFTNSLDDKNIFVNELKKFQENIKEDIFDIENLDYDISIIISLSYEKKNLLEDAKLGIKQLLKTKQNFIISNGLASLEQQKALKSKQTLSMVKNALNNLQITSYFQPIINNQNKQIEKYESLVRLIDEEQKVVSPYFFLETAKKGKYYSDITNVVLENSFSALNITAMDISINLSAIDIESKQTRQKLLSLLDEYSTFNNRIVFELLEDENVKDFELIKEFINTVKQRGVKIAIDDFGAGYSNFERLLEFNPDILKIDGSLIKNIETNQYSYSIVKTIVAFAKEQNIKTIAEFVEDENIFNIIKDIGIDYSQGYYFGKPQPLK